MIEDHLMLQLRYERFIKQVCETKSLYALESADGLATSSSHDYEDEDDNPIPLICFWSESDLATSCIQSGWQGFEIKRIGLADFLENWCVGMSGDGFLAGINFDGSMLGFEAEPNDLLLDLIAELNYLNASLSLERFDSLEDLQNQVKRVMES